jgi:two-component system, cell cycle response regulator CtrA
MPPASSRPGGRRRGMAGVRRASHKLGCRYGSRASTAADWLRSTPVLHLLIARCLHAQALLSHHPYRAHRRVRHGRCRHRALCDVRGYGIRCSRQEGVDLGKVYDYDIILLDLNLPDISGFQVLRTLRVCKVKTPVLILSGLSSIENKVTALGFGADDFMPKPFHKDELIARIRAIVRRSKGHPQSRVNVGDLCVNLDAKTVTIGDVHLHLTRKEYQMVELLSVRKGSTVTKAMFLNYLYGGIDEPGMKIIDVFICKLRKKLISASNGKDYIETVWGLGWMLHEPGEPSSFESLSRAADLEGGQDLQLHGIEPDRQGKSPYFLGRFHAEGGLYLI